MAIKTSKLTLMNFKALFMITGLIQECRSHCFNRKRCFNSIQLKALKKLQFEEETAADWNTAWGRLTISICVHLPEDLVCAFLRCALILRHLHHRGNHLVNSLRREERREKHQYVTITGKLKLLLTVFIRTVFLVTSMNFSTLFK